MLSLTDNISESSKVSVQINNKNFVNIYYGNILEVPINGINNIIMIPNYRNGLLYKLFNEKNLACNASFQQVFETDNEIDTCYLGKSELINIHHVIYFEYETLIDDPSKLFENIFKFMDNKNIINNVNLFIPTFGVNNGIRYFNVSLTLFYGIKSHINDENSLIHKLNEINVVTPYDGGKNKAIIYLMSLFTYYNTTLTEDDCMICLENKAIILLPCGHRILCFDCMKKIRNDNSICPLCRKDFVTYVECIKVNETNISCCDNSEKIKNICLPCCHSYSICTACNNDDICFYCKNKGKQYIFYG